jgi:hypothetical protein
MKHAYKTLIGATIVASMAFAGTATAQNLDADDATCRAALSKYVGKYQATAIKSVLGCHKGRNKGSFPLSTDCNVVATADSSTGGKVALARSAAQTAIVTACPDANVATVRALYGRCPSPSKTKDDGGATDGIDTMAEVASCVLDLQDQYVGRIMENSMGSIKALPASKLALGCQGAIGKGVAKYMKTVTGNRVKCQAASDKALGLLSYSAGTCDTADPTAKISGGLLKLNAGIAGKCVGDSADATRAALFEFGACGGSAAALQECVTERTAKPTGDGLVAAIYELPGTCAASADVVINAGYGQTRTDSELDAGWNGLGHNVDLVDQALGGVKLENCDNDCENCEVKLDPTNGYCRCQASPSIECDTINGADVDDCGGGTCQCMFGPPLPLSSGGTPVCVVNRFAEEFDGSTGSVGTYDVGTRTRAIVFLGETGAAPCPLCSDNGPMNDGVKAGTCSAGANPGAACDANAESPDFGRTSFDCMPDGSKNVTGTGLNLALRFSSGSTSLTAAIAPTGASGSQVCLSGGGNCFCSECTGDVTTGCSSNSDCSVLGLGNCGVAETPAPKGNNCDDGTCTNNICAGDTNPLTFCDGYLRESGGGIVPCTTDADCLGSDCGPGGCGNCTLQQNKPCFTSPITATGTPGIYSSEGVSTFCTAATSNDGVNGAGGLPGPGRVLLDFDFNVWCDAAHTTQMELPGGSNCP